MFVTLYPVALLEAITNGIAYPPVGGAYSGVYGREGVTHLSGQ